MKPRFKNSAAVSTLAVLAIGAGAGAGVAYASIPGADGKIHACYATTNGVLLGIPHSKGDVRIVDSAELCRSYEKSIVWTQNQPSPSPGATLPRSLYQTVSPVSASFATPVVSLDMPVGTWIVTFKAETANFGADCFLEAQAGGFGVAGSDSARPQGTDTGDVVPFMLTARMTFTQPGTAAVDCSTTSTDRTHTAIITDGVIEAIEVAPA